MRAEIDVGEPLFLIQTGIFIFDKEVLQLYVPILLDKQLEVHL